MLHRRSAIMALSGLIASGFAARAQDGAKTHVVTIDVKRSRFVPETLTIKAGDTIEWRNPGFVFHTVDFDPSLSKVPGNVLLPPGVAPFSSGRIEEGETYQHTFPTRGAYKYVCKLHESMGMVGSVTVA